MFLKCRCFYHFKFNLHVKSLSMRIPPLTTFLSRPKLTVCGLLVQCSASMKEFQYDFKHYLETKKATSLISSDLMPPVFKSLAKVQSINQGLSVHGDVIKMGFDSYTSTCNSIMSFYCKCGLMNSAMNLFDGMLNRDSVSWNAVIHGFLSWEDYEFGLGLFTQGRVSNFVPNISTLILVVQACWRLEAFDEGWNVHGFIIKSGVSTVISVQNSLLSMYVKSQDLDSAQRVFDEMPERDVISWSSLISGYAQCRSAVAALQLFQSMYVEGSIQIDGLAVVSVLQACTSAGDIDNGRLTHGYIIRSGFEGDVFVGNSLIDMYSKCLDVNSALGVFDQMSRTNIVSWNSILSGLVQNEKCLEALAMIDSMRKAGIEGDEITLVNLLHACKKLGLATSCKCVHSVVIRRLFDSNNFVVKSLLDAYMKCNLAELAWKLFERMHKRDVISWSTMIAGFVHSGKPNEAIAFFAEMQMSKEAQPNSVTMLSLLEACAISVELKLAKSAHCIVIRNHLAHDLPVGTALLDTYAKCGDLNSSRKVFHNLPEKNILSWNAMIGALGMNGCAKEALATLNEMERENLKPNGVSMLSVLSACSHGGLIQEGLSCLQRMSEDFLLKPSLEHYSCVVDMLGRAGNLESAFEVIRKIPEASPAAWGALLSACRSYGNFELGQYAASRVIELEPENSAGYLMSLSMFAKEGVEEGVARMRWSIRERRLKMMSGYSSVNVGNMAHKFVAWDGSHPRSEKMYSMVEYLHDCMNLADEERIELI